MLEKIPCQTILGTNTFILTPIYPFYNWLPPIYTLGLLSLTPLGLQSKSRRTNALRFKSATIWLYEGLNCTGLSVFFCTKRKLFLYKTEGVLPTESNTKNNVIPKSRRKCEAVLLFICFAFSVLLFTCSTNFWEHFHWCPIFCN